MTSEIQAYSLGSAAALLDMSRPALVARVRRGQVRVVKIGRTVRVPAAEVERLVSLPPVEQPTESRR